MTLLHLADGAGTFICAAADFTGERRDPCHSPCESFAVLNFSAAVAPFFAQVDPTGESRRLLYEHQAESDCARRSVDDGNAPRAPSTSLSHGRERDPAPCPAVKAHDSLAACLRLGELEDSPWSAAQLRVAGLGPPPPTDSPVADAELPSPSRVARTGIPRSEGKASGVPGLEVR